MVIVSDMLIDLYSATYHSTIWFAVHQSICNAVWLLMPDNYTLA